MRVIVTGATSGIGEAIARRLAAHGATVVLVGRSDERLEAAMRRIGGPNLLAERADLGLLADVRDLAHRLAAQPPPDVVISNAAVIAPVDDITAEGLQRTLVTNHLAPYLLLRSLVASIADRPARMILVGADPGALARVPVNLDDLADGSGPTPSFRPFALYGRTKNMNAMFGYALARRLSGTAITVNGAHPGVIRGTGLGRESRGALRVFGAVLSLVRPGPDTGADTPAWLAEAPEVAGVTGEFFVRRRSVPTAPHTTDPARCDRLWDLSEELVRPFTDFQRRANSPH
jgi:NAD(P)-dependent dehydrogenase (short-subunit alcohol dehydrogenase family)